MGFAEADRETLLAVRGNLLRGLDTLAAHVRADTLHVVPKGASTPPAASGWLMVVLLEDLTAQVCERFGAAAVPAGRQQVSDI